MTKVGEEEKEEKEKLAASMPRHFPEEMAEAKIAWHSGSPRNSPALSSLCVTVRTVKVKYF